MGKKNYYYLWPAPPKQREVAPRNLKSVTTLQASQRATGLLWDATQAPWVPPWSCVVLSPPCVVHVYWSVLGGRVALIISEFISWGGSNVNATKQNKTVDLKMLHSTKKTLRKFLKLFQMFLIPSRITTNRFPLHWRMPLFTSKKLLLYLDSNLKKKKTDQAFGLLT